MDIYYFIILFFLFFCLLVQLIENLLFIVELVQIKHTYQKTHGNVLKLPKVITLPPDILQSTGSIYSTSQMLDPLSEINKRYGSDSDGTGTENEDEYDKQDSWNDDNKYMTIDFNTFDNRVTIHKRTSLGCISNNNNSNNYSYNHHKNSTNNKNNNNNNNKNTDNSSVDNKSTFDNSNNSESKSLPATQRKRSIQSSHTQRGSLNRSSRDHHDGDKNISENQNQSQTQIISLNLGTNNNSTDTDKNGSSIERQISVKKRNSKSMTFTAFQNIQRLISNSTTTTPNTHPRSVHGQSNTSREFKFIPQREQREHVRDDTITRSSNGSMPTHPRASINFSYSTSAAVVHKSRPMSATFGSTAIQKNSPHTPHTPHTPNTSHTPRISHGHGSRIDHAATGSLMSLITDGIRQISIGADDIENGTPISPSTPLPDGVLTIDDENTNNNVNVHVVVGEEEDEKKKYIVNQLENKGVVLIKDGIHMIKPISLQAINSQEQESQQSQQSQQELNQKSKRLVIPDRSPNESGSVLSSPKSPNSADGLISPRSAAEYGLQSTLFVNDDDGGLTVITPPKSKTADKEAEAAAAAQAAAEADGEDKEETDFDIDDPNASNLERIESIRAGLDKLITFHGIYGNGGLKGNNKNTISPFPSLATFRGKTFRGKTFRGRTFRSGSKTSSSGADSRNINIEDGIDGDDDDIFSNLDIPESRQDSVRIANSVRTVDELLNTLNVDMFGHVGSKPISYLFTQNGKIFKKIILPQGLPVSRVLLKHETLFDQMQGLYEKYVKVGSMLEINISGQMRQFLTSFFDKPRESVKSFFAASANGTNGINGIDGIKSPSLNRIYSNSNTNMNNHSRGNFSKHLQHPSVGFAHNIMLGVEITSIDAKSKTKSKTKSNTKSKSKSTLTTTSVSRSKSGVDARSNKKQEMSVHSVSNISGSVSVKVDMVGMGDNKHNNSNSSNNIVDKEKNQHLIQHTAETYLAKLNRLAFNVFDQSAIELLNLMYGSFLRFTRTPQYKEFIHKMERKHQHTHRTKNLQALPQMRNATSFDNVFKAHISHGY